MVELNSVDGKLLVLDDLDELQTVPIFARCDDFECFLELRVFFVCVNKKSVGVIVINKLFFGQFCQEFVRQVREEFRLPRISFPIKFALKLFSVKSLNRHCVLVESFENVEELEALAHSNDWEELSFVDFLGSLVHSFGF